MVTGLTLVFAVISILTFGFSNEPLAADTKTMQIICPSTPGSSRDIYSRLLARYMPRYIPGQPTMIVKNMLGAGGDIALNHLYSRLRGDTRTIAHGTTSMYRVGHLGAASARYDLRKFNFVGAMPESPYLMVIRGNHPVKKFSELSKVSKPLFYGIQVAGTGGTLELVAHAAKLMGSRLKIVTGYRFAGRIAALQTGELDMTMTRLSVSQGDIQDGTMRILLILTHLESVPKELRGDAVSWYDLKLPPEVEKLSEFIAKPSDLDKTILAPPGVPADHVKMLREAFRETLKEPALVRRLAELGGVSPVITGEELQNEVVPRLLGIDKNTIAIVRKWLVEKPDN